MARILFERDLVTRSAVDLGIHVEAKAAAAFQLPWLGSFVDKVFDGSWGATPRYGLAGWKLLDNYKIRAILGDEAFNLGPGQVGPQHLELAIQRLERFHLVRTLRTSSGDDATAGWDGRSHEVGWHTAVLGRANQRRSHVEVPLVDPATWQQLEQINQYDIQLFKHFEEKA